MWESKVGNSKLGNPRILTYHSENWKIKNIWKIPKIKISKISIHSNTNIYYYFQKNMSVVLEKNSLSNNTESETHTIPTPVFLKREWCLGAGWYLPKKGGPPSAVRASPPKKRAAPTMKDDDLDDFIVYESARGSFVAASRGGLWWFPSCATVARRAGTLPFPPSQPSQA